MTERQLSHEIALRRKACNRINELKSSCQNLAEIREELSARLCVLNKVVDQLLAERTEQKYDPNLKIDLTSFHSNGLGPRSLKINDGPQQPTINDLIKSHDLPSLRNAYASQNPPSDAFKSKLSDCLKEIIPKAQEIASSSSACRLDRPSVHM